MISRLFYLMIICVLLFTVDGLGQNTWVKTFGGDLDFYRGKSIIPTNDDEFILTGFSVPPGNTQFDILVIKLNSTGDTIWKKTFGGSGSEEGSSITLTKDSGFVLTGSTNSRNGDFSGMNKGYNDIFVMKLNSSGDIVWKKTFGGSLDENGNSITTTKDGGFILTGKTEPVDGDFSQIIGGSDIFVMKLNSSGDIVWKKTFGGSSDDEGSSITLTDDGSFVLTGYTWSNDGELNGSDIIVMKMNSSGDIVWKKTFGGSDDEKGYSITTTNDGGYVLTGETYSNDRDFSGMNKMNGNIFVIKLDENGDNVWKKTFGGSGDENGYSITTTSNGEIVLTGWTSSNDGDFSGMNKGSWIGYWIEDIFVLKLNSSGDIVWKKTFGGSSNEWGHSIISTSDYGIVVTGGKYSNDGDFSGMNKGGSDIFVMKLDSNGNLNNTTSINELSEPTTKLSVHPNPLSNSTTISYIVDTPSNVRIELLNTLGQTIEVLREDYTDIGTYQLPLNTSTLSSGMYSVRMRSVSMSEVVPVWVVR